MYEPLWDELYQRMTEAGKSIRGIWIADVAHQGESGVLNEKKLGNDRSCTVSLYPQIPLTITFRDLLTIGR